MQAGCVPAATKGLRCEYPVLDDAFRGSGLAPGALRGRMGLMEHRPESARV